MGQEELIPPGCDQLRRIVDSVPKLCLSSLELRATIGKGNFGRVRMVRFKNSADATPFALKILSKVKIANEWGGSISHAARAVLRETSILEMVESAFVVNVLKVFHND